MASQLASISPKASRGAEDEHMLAISLLSSLADVKSAVLLVDFMDESPDDAELFVAMAVNMLDAIQ